MGLENKTSTWYIWMKFAAKINALKVVCNYFILVTQTEENPFLIPFKLEESGTSTPLPTCS